MKKVKRRKKYDPSKDGITQSLLAKFLSCRYAAMLYLQRLSKIGMKDTLIFGNLVHEILDAMNRLAMDIDLRKMKKKRRYKELLREGRMAIRRAEKKYSGTAPDPQSFTNMIGQIQLLLPKYLKNKEDEIRISDYDFKKRNIVASEEIFDVDFHGYKLKGKFDRAFDFGREFWIGETKTKGQISDAELEHSLLVDLQVKFYLTAAELHFGKLPEGVLYNIIRRPNYKIMKNFKTKLEGEPEHFFTRYEITFTKSDIQSFQERLRMMLDEFVQWTEGDLFTYENYTSCLGKRWNCDYLQYCATGDKSLYHTRDKLFSELVA